MSLQPNSNVPSSQMQGFLSISLCKHMIHLRAYFSWVKPIHLCLHFLKLHKITGPQDTCNELTSHFLGFQEKLRSLCSGEHIAMKVFICIILFQLKAETAIISVFVAQYFRTLFDGHTTFINKGSQYVFPVPVSHTPFQCTRVIRETE